MPDRDHLPRLTQVWQRHPLYFITTCCAQRRKILTTPTASPILTNAWKAAPSLHGWFVGRYVIMPDHVHFFARPGPNAKRLTAFLRNWKRWTSNQLVKFAGVEPPIWQPEFFDHLMRSADSYAEKWNYVRLNPVRAGLVTAPEMWPYCGELEPLPF
ncbi:MAG: transposase [Opitutaceae bacterium]|nr:transposase [Opitutaceae bacterium]